MTINYESLPVWELESHLEKLTQERLQNRALAKHITQIRDAKLKRGEPQSPAKAKPAEEKGGLLGLLGFGKKRGPDQAIKVG